MSKRPGTHGDHGRFARKESPALGVPALVEEDEFTGRYEGEELQTRRAGRSMNERIGRLETKHDSLTSIVGDVRVDVGQLKIESDAHGKTLEKIDQKLDLIVAGRVEFGRRIWLALIGGGGLAIWALQHFFGGR